MAAQGGALKWWSCGDGSRRVNPTRSSGQRGPRSVGRRKRRRAPGWEGAGWGSGALLGGRSQAEGFVATVVVVLNGW